jgi:beta-phosphoglucomutase
MKAAAGLDVDPADCIVFEESHSGVAAALAAGMRALGLTTTHAILQGYHWRFRIFVRRN